MDAKFIELFRQIAHSTSLLANRVSKSEYKNKTESSDKAATIIRDDYNELYQRLNDENFDSSTLTRQDYAKLLVGTSILVGNIENQITEYQNAVDNYKKIIIPALQVVFEKSENDEQAFNWAEHFFTITNEEEETSKNEET